MDDIEPTHVDTPEAFADAIIRPPKRVVKRHQQHRKTQSMCPHCGQLFRPCSLIPKHNITEPMEVPLKSIPKLPECPGSGQAPRNPLSDRRVLWNGKPNPHAV